MILQCERFKFSLMIFAAFALSFVFLFLLAQPSFAVNLGVEHYRDSEGRYFCPNCSGSGSVLSHVHCEHCSDGLDSSLSESPSVCRWCGGDSVQDTISTCPLCVGRGFLSSDDFDGLGALFDSDADIEKFLLNYWEGFPASGETPFVNSVAYNADGQLVDLSSSLDSDSFNPVLALLVLLVVGVFLVAGLLFAKLVLDRLF